MLFLSTLSRNFVSDKIRLWKTKYDGDAEMPRCNAEICQAATMDLDRRDDDF